MSTLRDRNDLPLLRGDDLTDEMLGDVAELAVEWQAERRATFSRANIIAEVAPPVGRRALRVAPTIGWPSSNGPPTSPWAQSLQVHRPRAASHPAPLPTARTGPPGCGLETTTVYTTESLLDAEARLLDAGRDIGAAATVPVATVAGGR